MAYRTASHLPIDEATRALEDVLRTGLLSGVDGGPQVHAFESEFSEFVGMPHATGVTSGSAALLCALRALDLEPGDEIIVPAFTFIADLLAILHCNARPVFADIDPATYCIRPDEIERLASERTRAVIVVHLFGRAAAIDRIATLASEGGFALIEDCCQAHGATSGGRRVGSFGDLACFSFSQGHIISGGGGGMVLTRDPDLAERVRCLRFFGVAGTEAISNDELRDHDALGFNFAMTELAAALCRIQLRNVADIIAARREAADVYAAALGSEPFELAPDDGGPDRPTYHLFPVRLPSSVPFSRAEFARELRRRGVGFLITYPRALHDMTVVRNNPYRPTFESLPVAEDYARRTIGLFCGGVSTDTAREWGAEVVDALATTG
jgi:perosamine synthetase